MADIVRLQTALCQSNIELTLAWKIRLGALSHQCHVDTAKWVVHEFEIHFFGWKKTAVDLNQQIIYSSNVAHPCV